MVLNFDASKIEISSGFELIPNGDYKALIIDTEWKENKAKTGGYLNLKVEIIDGQYKGRVFFEMLNLQNANPKAVEIAEQTLAKICLAINKPNVKDSSEILNIPLMVKMGSTPAQNGYEAQNKIKNFSAMNNDNKVIIQMPKEEGANTPPWKK